jgi:hypothetical protein
MGGLCSPCTTLSKPGHEGTGMLTRCRRGKCIRLELPVLCPSRHVAAFLFAARRIEVRDVYDLEIHLCTAATNVARTVAYLTSVE